MTFNKVSQYSFSCDSCHDNLSVHDGWRKSDAIKEARSEGWRIGKKHICPECKATDSDKEDV